MYTNADDVKEEIMTHYYAENYKECIVLCNEFMQIIDKNNEQYTYFMWFVCTTLAISYKCEYEYDIAIKNAKTSLNYAIEPEQYARSEWIIARCYEGVSVESAIKYYDKCIAYYLNYDRKFMLATIYNNKGELLGDEQLLLDAIAIYNKELEKDNSDDIKSYIFRAMDDTYRILAQIYISKKMTIQAYKTIKLINDKNIKKALKAEILSE